MARLTTIIQGSKPKTISSNPLSYSGRQPKAGGIQSCKGRGDRPSSCPRAPHQPQSPGANLASERLSHTVSGVSGPCPASPISPELVSPNLPGSLHPPSPHLAVLLPPSPHLDSGCASRDLPTGGWNDPYRAHI